MSVHEIEIIRPDDFHHHLRDDAVLKDVLAHTSRIFHRILAMPNLKPPIRNLSEAMSYRNRILSSLPSNLNSAAFTPLMSLYLTDKTTPADIYEAKSSGLIVACKLYPAGATTNSEHGVTVLDGLRDTLQAMSDVGLVLCIHGEVTDQSIDIFDREKVFIDTILKPLISSFPKLKIVMEHVTTKEAVEFVKSAPSNVAATITAHHLLYNRNDIFKGGVCPHMYCLPVLKREIHRQALLSAATSSNPKFFCGTDSAPHAIGAKESSCGCAGIFTAHAAVELYTEAFDSVDALAALEGFMSRFGAEFYGLPVNTEDKIKLIREPWVVPDSYPFGDSVVVPLRRNQQVMWRLKD